MTIHFNAPDFIKKNDKYKLTVIVWCYNQEKYIEQALESILSQNVDYQYQIYISDDCSTDGTVEKIKKYSTKHDNIILFESMKNDGFYKNSFQHFERAIQRADTEYITFLAGDDYYTDNNKLQKQYDILENNSDCVGSITSYYEFNKDNVYKLACAGKSNQGFVSQIATLFLRNILDISKYDLKILLDDCGLPFLYSLYGQIHYLPEPTSFYRQTSASVFVGQDEETTWLARSYIWVSISGYLLYNHYTDFRFCQIVESLFKYKLEYVEKYFYEGSRLGCYTVYDSDLKYIEASKSFLRAHSHVFTKFNQLRQAVIDNRNGKSYLDMKQPVWQTLYDMFHEKDSVKKESILDKALLDISTHHITDKKS